jgi:hypothetical protein
VTLKINPPPPVTLKINTQHTLPEEEEDLFEFNDTIEVPVATVTEP